MLLVAAVASMAVFSVAVLAPEAAPAIGFDPAYIGGFNAVVYLFAMFIGTITGVFVERYGAIRVSQVALLAAGAGILLLALVSPFSALLSAICLGIAYGPLNPASANVLIKVGNPRWWPLIFSIKQTGIPLGGMLAGALTPWLAAVWGWQGAACIIAGLALLSLLLAQPLRRSIDADRKPGKTLADISVTKPLKMVFSERLLRGLTMVGFVYAGCQVSVGAFYVVYLVHDLDMALTRAGFLFAVLQLGGVCGRIIWGSLAGRWMAPNQLLAVLGLLTAICLVITTVITLSWPWWQLAILGFVLGASSFGWNGVFLSEVARLAPEGKAGEITGGVQFVMFGGVVVVPPCFSLIVTLSQSYTIAFNAVAFMAVLIAGYLLVFRQLR
jgi:MFS family permease